MKKIAIDAMGGDNAPKAIVEGVNRALAEFSDIEIQLYGDEAKIKEYLTATERVSVVHTDEKINSDDEPAKAIRRKKKASMVLGAQAVKEGTADAVISAGNTGALLAAGLFVVGRIKGIDRPGLMSTLPTLDGKVEMKIPSGIQSGTIMRLKGKGIPFLRGAGRGDQHVRIKVLTPQKLTDRQKELLREFAGIKNDKANPEQESFFKTLKNLFK